jgi:hypothetical protein
MRKLIVLLGILFMLISCTYIKEAQIPRDVEIKSGCPMPCPILSATQPSTGEAKTWDELMKMVEFVSPGV